MSIQSPLFFLCDFLNSLIIHEEKTEQITTMKEVFLFILKFGELLLRFFPRIIKWLKKLYRTLERVFHPISKHLEVGKKKQKKNNKKHSAAPRFINPLLSV